MAIQAQLYSDNIGFPVCGSQDWIDINGCSGGAAAAGGGVGGGGFNQFGFSLQQKPQLQQQQQLQPLQNQQQKNQCLYSNNNEIYCQNLAFQIEKQRHEIDQFVRSQNERLRLLLLEQRKQQVAILIKKIESKANFLLRQKDEEILKATNKAMELQNLLTKLEMENQAWQRVAQENEAMVLSLNNTLEQLQATSHCFNNNNGGGGAEDAESCCEVNRDEGMETEQNRDFAVGGHGQEQDVETTKKMTTTTMVCKCCNSRSTCVLFLPCRHLCSCKDCAAFVDTCPVCGTAKKACIEALIS